jgi:hypothetical protein
MARSFRCCPNFAFFCNNSVSILWTICVHIHTHLCGRSPAAIVGSNPTGAWMFVCCVCCQVEVSATSWSLVQRIPIDCGASLIKKPRGRGGHSPRWATAPEKIIIIIIIIRIHIWLRTHCILITVTAAWNFFYTNQEHCEVLAGYLSLRPGLAVTGPNTWHWTERFSLLFNPLTPNEF